MARAAAGLARVCAQLLGGAYGSRVLLLVGAGNNGGDVLHAGAMLARRGARVEALLLADRVHEPGLAALRRAGGRIVTDGDGDVAGLLPRADRESDKYRRGVVGVAAGSAQYTGAAVLCAGGALRGGAGMVRYLGADEPAALVRAQWPEVVVGEGRVQAWAVGSGAGDDAAGRLDRALADDVPTVVDADALEALAGQSGRRGRSVPLLLTPHAGELARLVGADRDDVEDRRLHHATTAETVLGAVVLLKGPT